MVKTYSDPPKKPFDGNFNAKEAAGTTKIIIIAMIVIVLVGTGFYIYTMMNYESSHCKVIKEVYTDVGKVSSINLEDVNFKGYDLRDFYIKSAYNCCAIGEFRNTFVDVCALKQVIRQGVRVLDFQIFSVNNKPVIAVSSIPCDYSSSNIERQCYLIKESYNSVNFSNAMDIIANYAFAGDTCPNPNDPLILHFRIMSVNDKIYSDMNDILRDKFANKMLGKEYSYEYNGKSLANVGIENLVNKVIIAVDKANPYFEDTPLEELVNICSNSVFMRCLREKDVKYTPDYTELVEFNKKCLTLELPDVSASDDNPSASLGMKYGCQMVGMCYQNYDSNLEYYETFFASAGYSFVLKPEALRYTLTTIAPPTPQNPDVSYADKTYQSDYYDFNI